MGRNGTSINLIRTDLNKYATKSISPLVLCSARSIYKVRVELDSDRNSMDTLLCKEVCSGLNVSFRDGIATFGGLCIHRASIYRLKFYTDIPLPNGQSVLSNEFKVRTGMARKLELIREPGGSHVFGGKAFLQQPRLYLLDAGGNSVIKSEPSSVVTVAIHSNPSGGTLLPESNLVAQVEFGIAQFKHLMIDKAGQGYTLIYSYFIVEDGYRQETDISVIGEYR